MHDWIPSIFKTDNYQWKSKFINKYRASTRKLQCQWCISDSRYYIYHTNMDNVYSEVMRKTAADCLTTRGLALCPANSRHEEFEAINFSSNQLMMIWNATRQGQVFNDWCSRLGQRNIVRFKLTKVINCQYYRVQMVENILTLWEKLSKVSNFLFMFFHFR